MMVAFCIAAALGAGEPPDPLAALAKYGVYNTRTTVGGLICRPSDLLQLASVRKELALDDDQKARVGLRFAALEAFRTKAEKRLADADLKTFGKDRNGGFTDDELAAIGPAADAAVVEGLRPAQAARLMQLWAQMLGPWLAANVPPFAKDIAPTPDGAVEVGQLLGRRSDHNWGLPYDYPAELERINAARQKIVDAAFTERQRAAWLKAIGAEHPFAPADYRAIENLNGACVLRRYPLLRRTNFPQLFDYLKADVVRTELSKHGADDAKLNAVAARVETLENPVLRLVGALEFGTQHRLLDSLKLKWFDAADAVLVGDGSLPPAALKRLRQIRSQHIGLGRMFSGLYSGDLGITQAQGKALGPLIEKYVKATGKQADYSGMVPIMKSLLTKEQLAKFPEVFGEELPLSFFGHINVQVFRPHAGG